MGHDSLFSLLQQSLLFDLFLFYHLLLTNFFAPGSGAKYAVPIIGDLTLIPSLSHLKHLRQF